MSSRRRSGDHTRHHAPARFVAVLAAALVTAVVLGGLVTTEHSHRSQTEDVSSWDTKAVVVAHGVAHSSSRPVLVVPTVVAIAIVLAAALAAPVTTEFVPVERSERWHRRRGPPQLT